MDVNLNDVEVPVPPEENEPPDNPDPIDFLVAIGEELQDQPGQFRAFTQYMLAKHPKRLDAVGLVKDAARFVPRKPELLLLLNPLLRGANVAVSGKRVTLKMPSGEVVLILPGLGTGKTAHETEQDWVQFVNRIKEEYDSDVFQLFFMIIYLHDNFESTIAECVLAMCQLFPNSPQLIADFVVFMPDGFELYIDGQQIVLVHPDRTIQAMTDENGVPQNEEPRTPAQAA